MSTTIARAQAVFLHKSDNVAVASRMLAEGSEVAAGPHTVTLSEPVKLGHKLALVPIRCGEPVVKYGQIIGFATRDIAPGQWVHTHNLSAGQFARDYAFCEDVPPAPEPITGRTFLGYRREDGRAGTRNYIAVVSSVNCSASVSRYVCQRFDRQSLRDYPNVDGVFAVTHKGGCGLQYDGEDHQQLTRTLAGFARHANVGAYLLIGLGCETGTLGYLMNNGGLIQIGAKGGGDGDGRPIAMSMQDLGGTAKTIDAAVAKIAELLPRANDVRRVPIPAGEIILGTNCGGSDGNSGITANPALGVASDMLVAAGGTTVLAETTEIYGAEHLLTRRAKTRQVGEKLVERIRWWEKYVAMFGAEIDNNPSPGNKEGGLTTIYEKSLGAVAKAGSTAMTEVYRYSEPVAAKGFVVMDTPGLDNVSVTGLVAGGCNVVAFTTGRGSCFGCKPAPSIKIATNTPMYERMKDDMDINAGVILEGVPVREVGRQIFEFILEVAGGRKTKSELLAVGDEEFAPWSIGPTL
ncbi:MAG: altronate dehydratase [Planctomycetia bacterium]|nr:altronate dehydratase [Planctomycetia bacterium]